MERKERMSGSEQNLRKLDDSERTDQSKRMIEFFLVRTEV